MALASPKFTDFLNMREDEVKQVPLLPAGSWEFVVRSWDAGETRPNDPKQQKLPVVKFTIIPATPGSDVDAEALAEYEANGGTFSNEEMSYEQVIGPKSQRSFLDDLIASFGATRGQSVAQMLAETIGARFKCVVAHRTSQKSQRPYAAIDRLLPLDANI